MTTPFRHIAAALIIGLATMMSAMSAPGAPGSDTEDKATQIWQLLDYMAVDYAGAVSRGEVTNVDEYAEMKEFSQTAERLLGGLPDKPAKSELLEQARLLKEAVLKKAPEGDVADIARGLAASLLNAYPVPMAPAKTPDLKRGATLYQSQCASCHGMQGGGDGPLAARLEPPPIAFTDRDRARERSVFSLHQSITRGVEGTSMPAFTALSDEDRWALAFFVSTLAFTDDEKSAGQSAWATEKSAQAAVPNLQTLTQISESALEKTLVSGAGSVLAYLRGNPETLTAAAAAHAVGGQLTLAKSRLRESLAAIENGDALSASRLALSAYLDGFEAVEPALAIKDKVLLGHIEQAMAAYRAAISRGDLAGARDIEARLQTQLDSAQAKLDDEVDDKLGVFLAALAILLREGVEALLVVVAMIAFLKKSGRNDVLPYVHAGWVAALAAGGLTWFAATYLIDISGASRELTEGFSAIFAAVVLLAVGIWMHQKSLGGRWQAYIRDKLSASLGRRSRIMLFILAFVTVYREVFETVLFYAALWTEGGEAYLLGGLLLGTVLLGLIAAVMLRTSARLPISQFFAVSSVLIAVLAVVLIGKGSAALQEAGWLNVTPLDLPRLDLLGVYPSLQTISAQLLVLLIVIGSMLFNARTSKRQNRAAKIKGL